MENDNLQFKGGNPGAVQHGNFINYYQFHPTEERLKLLPQNVWNNDKPSDKPCIALDMGCNAGDLTVALYAFLKNSVTEDCSILGVDIDPILIKRAEETNNNDNISFKCLDFMDQNNREVTIKNYLNSKGVEKFSVVFCFSTTMWIHLNNGDQGLNDFLRGISNISEMVIIEPQPWKCYKSAVRRMKRNCYIFPLFSELKIRDNVEEEIERCLEEDCNFKKIAETNRTKWNRKLLVFKQ